MRCLRKGPQTLSCPLTQSEFDSRAQELARTHEAIGGEMAAQDFARKEGKLRLTELEEKRDRLAKVVRERAEERTVEIELHADDVRGTVMCVRMDTGECYDERPINASERQLAMPGVLPPIAPTPADAGAEGNQKPTTEIQH